MKMPLRISFQAETDALRSLDSVAQFLDDFAALYKAAVILSNPNYEQYRDAQSLDDITLAEDDRLAIERLSVGSITAVLLASAAAVTAVLGVLTITEKVLNWKLDRRLKNETLEKTARENREARRISAETVASELESMAAESG